MSSGIYNKHTGYHNRRSIRLKGNDYSQSGYYFVTICGHDRKLALFGEIISNEMRLNEFGKIVQNEILKTEQMRPNVKINEYMIMPNHVHIILHICEHDSTSGSDRRGMSPRARIPQHGEMDTLDCNRRGTLPCARIPQNGEKDILDCDGPGMSNCNNNISGCNGKGTLPRAPTRTEQFGKSTSNSIPTIIRLLKSTTTKQINISRNTPGDNIWQRNYYEHIIRDEKSLYAIKHYIRDNPKNWERDIENHIVNELGDLNL